MSIPVLRLPLALFLVSLAFTPSDPGAAQERSCFEFDSQIRAQTVLDDDPLGATGLDPEGNGVACEELPRGSAPATWVAGPPENAFSAKFVVLIEGDTIQVRIGGQHQLVRFCPFRVAQLNRL